MVQVELMNDESVSPKTRSDAAAHVMNHTRPPEVKKMEVSVGVLLKTLLLMTCVMLWVSWLIVYEITLQQVT